jgi:broad specificity phosphatase PhoE
VLELIIARHGETAWNAGDIFRGRVSIGLSEKGLQQAEQLADYLSRKKIQAVYCSPLQRAFQTAEAVARRQQLQPQAVADLTDLDFGKWEGLPRQEVKNKYSQIYELWLERPDLAVIPEAESLESARKRTLSALDRIMADHKEGAVAIITHRVITKILECALLGLDNSHFWNLEHDTCGVTTFIHNGRRFILTHHNDVSFLK